MIRQFARLPRITAEMVFLPAEEGGRQWPPDCSNGVGYLPHLVIQDRSVRKASVINGQGAEDYLGVALKASTGPILPGESNTCVLELM